MRSLALQEVLPKHWLHNFADVLTVKWFQCQEYRTSVDKRRSIVILPPYCFLGSITTTILYSARLVKEILIKAINLTNKGTLLSVLLWSLS